MAKKKTDRAKMVEGGINLLDNRVWSLFQNRGYNTKSEVIKMLILDLVELIMDCQSKAVEEALNKLTKRLFKEKKK